MKIGEGQCHLPSNQHIGDGVLANIIQHQQIVFACRSIREPGDFTLEVSQYFVRRISEGRRWEIQLLNSVGKAIACGNLEEDTMRLVLNGRDVPERVLQAARTCRTLHDGKYVDGQGNVVKPF